MAKAEIPDAILAPPTEEELAAAKKYARTQMGRIGDGSLLHDPAAMAIATASRNEVSARAELEMILGKLEQQPENESLKARVPALRERMCKSLRDQGRIYEALQYADTPSIKEGLERGLAALNRDDSDFDCAAGCEDDIKVIDGAPRQIPRWNMFKHNIPRVKGPVTEIVSLWRCSKCMEMNASKSAPESRRAWDRAVQKATQRAKETDTRIRDGEVMPVYHAE